MKVRKGQRRSRALRFPVSRIRIFLFGVGVAGVFLLIYAWLWFLIHRGYPSVSSRIENIPIRTFEDDCPSHGCSIYPPEMLDVQDQVDALVDSTNGAASLPYGNEIMATMTRKSNRHNPPFNQDEAVIITPFRTMQTTNDLDFFLGIFDGHGDEGHIVAQYAAKAVPERLAEKLNTFSVPQDDSWIIEAMKNTFVEVDIEAPPNAMRGGCTASVTLRRGNKIFVANAGDSRTFIVTVSSDNEELHYSSRKDKPNLPDERERISKLGGKIHIPEQNPMLSRVIVYSTVAREQVGLAMSRSIGDWEWGVVGVTAEPLVDVIDVSKLANAFVLSASDGLFDRRRPQFVAKHFADSFYRHGDSPIATCQDMIKLASPTNETLYRDDITIVVMKIL